MSLFYFFISIITQYFFTVIIIYRDKYINLII